MCTIKPYLQGYAERFKYAVHIIETEEYSSDSHYGNSLDEGTAQCLLVFSRNVFLKEVVER